MPWYRTVSIHPSCTRLFPILTSFSCALLSSRVPLASPKPALKTCVLSSPVLGGSQAAERFLRARISLARANVDLQRACLKHSPTSDIVLDLGDDVTDAETEVDRCLLKLIEEACKANKATRALDLASRLNLSKSFEFGVKVANFYKMPQLAERMVLVAKTKVADARRAKHEKERSQKQQDVPKKDFELPAAFHDKHRPSAGLNHLNRIAQPAKTATSGAVVPKSSSASVDGAVKAEGVEVNDEGLPMQVEGVTPEKPHHKTLSAAVDTPKSSKPDSIAALKARLQAKNPFSRRRTAHDGGSGFNVCSGK
mmetsp:Transcript_11964/g.30163  ORF Transcript_11964/g.30163 Transcript_11964/m.30163 type:complete len:310 (+) Transcript_11964:806-1735(+)